MALVLQLCALLASLLACAKTGEQCGAVPCCNASPTLPADHCEPVDAHYSKCVTQPVCAKAYQQCAGSGQSVMEKTPCCDSSFECVADSEYYSGCKNASAPPPPPPKTCAVTNDQCGGDGSHINLPCCNHTASCEVVDANYSKCVYQPVCAAQDAPCNGTGHTHHMSPTPCCDPSTTCAQWGDEWSVCRAKGHETCSDLDEQCAGSGDSAMRPKPCCDPANKCIKVSDYFSKCDAPKACVNTNEQCAGTGHHTMDPLPCCASSNTTCVQWGDEWSLCRAKGHETCSDLEEQCAGAGDSAMKPKPCCDPANKCTKLNDYYSKCTAAEHAVATG